MFNLLKPNNDLLSSDLYDEIGFYPAFLKDIKHAKKSIVIESPFLTEKRARQFCGIFVKQARCGITITINTRHPNYQFYTANDVRHLSYYPKVLPDLYFYKTDGDGTRHEYMMSICSETLFFYTKKIID